MHPDKMARTKINKKLKREIYLYFTPLVFYSKTEPGKQSAN